jgi:hypothetical protein
MILDRNGDGGAHQILDRAGRIVQLVFETDRQLIANEKIDESATHGYGKNQDQTVTEQQFVPNADFF